MDRRFVTRLLLAAIGLLAVGAVVLPVTRSVDEAERAIEESLLLEGDFDAARRRLADHTDQLPLLLRRALDQGEYAASLELLEEHDPERRQYPVFAAAALLELGQDTESLAAWSGDGRSGGLAARVAEAQRLRQRGAVRLARDRRGRLLGSLERDGTFSLREGTPESAVPREVGELLRRSEGRVGVRLTLDLELTRLAQAALEGYRGSIVLVDLSSGEVLAAVSDRHSFRRGGTPAFEELREPASIAKLLTASAALRAGIDPDREIAAMRCRGAIRLDDEPLYCSAINGRLRGLDHALAVSCNVAFAQLGIRVGAGALVEEYRRFGFAVGEEPRHPFLGRVSKVELAQRQLGDLAIGLNEAEITPLHAALVGAAMARGVLPGARLLGTADGLLGISPLAESLPSTPLAGLEARPVLPDWRMGGLQRAMLAVAGPWGTAARVDNDRFRVAMKTGTGRDPGYYFHVNYIGIGPMPEPTLAFAVRITGQPTSRRVRRAAFRVTKRLLTGLGDNHAAWVGLRRGRPSTDLAPGAEWAGPVVSVVGTAAGR